MLPGQISPDGLWVWEGTAWLPTTSADGLWRWDGYRWMPLPGPAGAASPAPSPTTRALLLAGVAVAMVGVLAIAGIAASGRRDGPRAAAAPVGAPSASGVPGFPGAPAGTQVYDVPSRDHTVGHVEYAQTPPVGGDHAPLWLNCGIYDQPVPKENAVHSLEHGVVWVTYDPARVDAQGVDLLRAVVSTHYDGTDQRYVILSPFPGLPAPVVASAWGVQLRLPRATDPRLPAFIDYFRQGPETPEKGGLCSSGAGRPIDGPGSPSGPVTLGPGGRRVRA